MIPLINHDSQWGRSEVVIIYPDICTLYILYICTLYMYSIITSCIYIYIDHIFRSARSPRFVAPKLLHRLFDLRRIRRGRLRFHAPRLEKTWRTGVRDVMGISWEISPTSMTGEPAQWPLSLVTNLPFLWTSEWKVNLFLGASPITQDFPTTWCPCEIIVPILNSHP